MRGEKIRLEAHLNLGLNVVFKYLLLTFIVWFYVFGNLSEAVECFTLSLLSLQWHKLRNTDLGILPKRLLVGNPSNMCVNCVNETF